jgi:hypothetical protein
MDNCVGWNGYDFQIICDSCRLFSLQINGERFSMQLATSKIGYKIEEIKGYNNSEPCEKALKIAESIAKRIEH